MALFKTLLFTIFVPGTVTVVVPYLLLSARSEPLTSQLGIFRWLGVLPIAVGAAFYLRCAWAFATVGQGTPAAFDPPKVFVASGLYRYVRNPMYVGVLLILTGEAIVFAAARLVAFAAFMWLGFQLFVVFYEEPTLQRKFGASYEEYRKRVPRWIPTL